MADVVARLVFFLFGVFFNQYRSLDCCTVLSGKVFLKFLLWRISLFCLFFFHSLWSDQFYSVGVRTFWMLALCVMLFYTILDVGTVRYVVLYCFCPPCCDHCAGFWVTENIFRKRSVFLRRPKFYPFPVLFLTTCSFPFLLLMPFCINVYFNVFFPQCPHMSLWTSWSSLLGMVEV